MASERSTKIKGVSNDLVSKELATEETLQSILGALGGGAYSLILDEATSTISYVGIAATGSATSDPVWQIKRIDTSVSPQTIIKFANGSSSFANIFDNRASLTYI